jgi:hypothetical protein
VGGGETVTLSQWIWTHLSFAFVIAAAMVAVAQRAAATKQLSQNDHATAAWRWSVCGAVAGAFAIGTLPLRDVDLSGYLLAFTGELSFATLFYLGVYLTSSSGIVAKVDDREWNGLRLTWLVAGFVLYASVLGGRGIDVYSLGFGSLAAWAGLALSASLAIGGRWLGAVMVLGIIVAWQLSLCGSVNFWDYAIDPFLFLGSLLHVLLALPARVASVSGIIRWRERKLSGPPTEEVSAAVP